MNDTFNLKRFGWLFKKTIFERPTQLAGGLVVALLIDAILFAILRFINLEWEVIQIITFITGFVGGGCLLASFIFNYFSSNASGTSFLNLPASSLEKWLCGVIIVGVIYTAIFLVFFRSMDTIFVWQLHKTINPNDLHYEEMYDKIKVLPFDNFIVLKSYMMFGNFTGAMMIGSLYFNKSAFIKIALIACGLYIGGHFLNQLIANMIIPNIDKALPYYCVFVPVGDEVGKVLLPGYASKLVDICAMGIVPGILWVTTLVRLREKEF